MISVCTLSLLDTRPWEKIFTFHLHLTQATDAANFGSRFLCLRKSLTSDRWFLCIFICTKSFSLPLFLSLSVFHVHPHVNTARKMESLWRKKEEEISVLSFPEYIFDGCWTMQSWVHAEILHSRRTICLYRGHSRQSMLPTYLKIS